MLKKMNMFSCPREANNNSKMMINNGGNNTIVNNNTEEFSFPVVSNNHPLSNLMLSSTSASSSSLWRISSRVYHHPEYHEDQEDDEEKDNNGYDHVEVQSMCEEISASSRKDSVASASFRSKEMEVEESMDYLWEDFNEEEKIEVKERKFGEELRVLKMARMGSRRQSIGSGSSSKLLVIGKLLKGLVSIRRSAQNKLLKTKN